VKPNFPYHLARAQGYSTRWLYRAFLPAVMHRRVEASREVPFQVFSYSGEATLPEQVASIRSFLLNAGRPKRFTVVSDGTYSRQSIQLLQEIDSVVRVEEVPAPDCGLPQRMSSYLQGHPTGKQLALIMSLPRTEPAFYVDSDVLFFPGADDLIALFESSRPPAFYLEDCGFAGDDRILETALEKTHPVNTGVLFLFEPLDWSLSINRFGAMNGAPNFFTNQTMTHVTMRENGAKPFDRSKYVLELDDQFVYRDRYANPAIALRHYVNPIRHKFWTSLRW
jgi:hypothetical protein